MTTMRRFVYFALCILHSALCTAAVTTYTFTSTDWKSRVDATVCDGQTDGWISDMNAYSYSAGNIYADGSLNNCGVSVKTSTSGAGAHSVVSFSDVRRITFNFCQNSSKGRGIIYVQVGDAPVDSIVVNKPAYSGAGTLNRDSVVTMPSRSGVIRFWIKCTENAINLNTITIHSAEGGSSPFTTDTYQLVTDVAQLQDSDKIIIGVAQPGVNYAMGYFDETVSQNNIHAIAARYSADRTTIAPDDRAIYTLHRHISEGDTVYTIVDDIRYWEAYLVASGGQTKNRLALWDTPTSPNYGDYGLWSIAIATDGRATIMSRGNSLGKYIQYNAQNHPTLFGCYAQPTSQTGVCIYRRVPALGDTTAIVAPLLNFGTTLEQTGERTIQVNAHGLSGDITARLATGTIFSLMTTTLDREGDALSVRYSAPAPGHYTDTLILRSGATESRTLVLLHVVAPMTVRQAKSQPDYATTYLGDVVVTKKYDTYIYVRDSTGSMLLYDNGDGTTGKRYGAGLKQGDKLRGVVGRSLNYYGVPELNLTQALTVLGQEACLPEAAGEAIDSTDVCRCLRLDEAEVSLDGRSVSYHGQDYPLTDKFHIGALIPLRPTTLTCIVSWDWDTLTLYPITQEVPTAVETPSSFKIPNSKFIRNGALYIATPSGVYNACGALVSTSPY